ncbi:MAG TPA: hypothetical protein VF678_01510 [bacterium]
MPEAGPQRLPDDIACGSCGTELIGFGRNARTKQITLSLSMTKPPAILNEATYQGELTCDRCGAKTPIDLRVFLLGDLQPPG